jgi:hypothetical protein
MWVEVWNLLQYLRPWVWAHSHGFLLSNIISMRKTRRELWIFQKLRQLWQLQGFVSRHWHCTFQYILDTKVKICTYCSSAHNRAEDITLDSTKMLHFLFYSQHNFVPWYFYNTDEQTKAQASNKYTSTYAKSKKKKN